MNLVVAFLFSLPLVAFQATPGPSAAPAAGPTSAPNLATDHTMVVDGLTRDYLLYKPANIAVGSHPPLVVAMHGYSGTAAGVESHYFWDQEADKGGFIVVFPNGIERSWNSGNCCADAFEKKIDDVKFLTLLVQQMEKDQNVDPHHIYFTGMSNGALMSYRMACEASFPIAAIGPVGGTLDIACPHPQKTSLISVNGGADVMIPFNGGKSADASNVGADVRPWRINLPPIPDVLAKWLALDNCTPFSVTKTPPVTTEIATCADRRAVEEIVVDGAGHQWPGGAIAGEREKIAIAALLARGIHVDPPSQALSATDTIWQFFSTKVSP